jgi:hypothetical protein
MAFPDRTKRTVEVAHPAATAAALTGTLGLAAASWVIAVWQMNGMDMGIATQLGSLGALSPYGWR